MQIYENLFKVFRGRENAHALCRWDEKTRRYSYYSVARAYDVKLLKRHCTDPKFSGIGIYPIIGEDQTQWVAADFDVHNEKEKKEFDEALKRIFKTADGIECNLYKEVSKSGQGAHLWMFFTEAIEAWKARKLMMALLEASKATHLSSMDRLFPSQDRVHQRGKKYGNLIHLPFSAGFIKQGTWFEDREGEKYLNTPDDIEAWLDIMIPHSPEYVDTILNKWGLAREVDQSLKFETDDLSYEYSEDGLTQVLNDPFLQWCQSNPKDVDYSAWIAMISNLLPYGEEGVKAIHHLSSLDPSRYDQEATQQKIIDLTGVNPITHNWIALNTNFTERPDVGYKSPAAAGVKTNKIYTSIFENWGRYYKETKNGNVELTNFLITPTKLVCIDNKIQRIFDFKSQTKMIRDIPVSGEQLSGATEFRKLTMDIAHNTLYYGTAQDLLKLVDYLNQAYPNIPQVTGKAAVGLHYDEIHNEWVVVTQSSSWSVSGVRDDIIYYNPSQRKELIYDHAPIIKDREIKEIADNLFNFNSLPVVSSILAWMFTLPVAERMYKQKGLRFPVLMIHGQAGSGKTETARGIIQRFFGDTRPMFSISDITKFSMEAMGTSSNMFPIALDEYKPGGLDNWKIRAVSSFVRNLYDHSSGQKGRKDLSTVEFPVTSPLVICGEQGFEEPALIERSLDVFLSKTDSSDHYESFKILKQAPLSRLGNAYLNWTLTVPDENIIQLYTAAMGDKPTDRPTHNIAMMKVGIDLLYRYFKAQGITINPTPLKEAMETIQTEHVRLYGTTRSVVDNILEAIFIMKANNELDETCIREDSKHYKFLLHVPTLYPQFKKWAREYSFDYEIISQREFMKQIRKMEYYEETKTARMGSDSFTEQVRKVIILDETKLRKAGIIEI